MQHIERKDNLENKETLNYLVDITVKLNFSNAIVGRNDKMFVVDINKSNLLSIEDNESLSNLFTKRNLVYSSGHAFGSKSIVTSAFTGENLLFYNIEDSLLSENDIEDQKYPYHREVRNWFLNIPELPIDIKEECEAIYHKADTETSALIRNNADALFRAIFSLKKKKK